MSRFPAAIGRTPQQRYNEMRFTCRCCAKREQGPRALIKLTPDAIHAVPERDRARRAKTSPDLAVLDNERFFIRGVLLLPVREADPAFEFGVWAEVSKVDFKTYLAEYENPRPQFGPFACALDSDLQPYDSRGLPGFLTMRPDKHRPTLGFEGDDHQLARDQHAGLSLSRLAQIYRAWGHSVRL
jgi:hypothetical protein